MTVYVVKGNDPLLRTDALERLLTRVLDGDDRSLALEEFLVAGKRATDEQRAADDRDNGRENGQDGGVVDAILNAAESPPLVTARRVIVVRDYEQIPAADTKPLVDYLANPLDTTVLVLVSGGGRVAKALADALKSAGVETVGPDVEKTSDVLARAVASAGLALRADAQSLVVAHLGDDAGRVGAFVEVLAGAYGPDAVLEAADVEPYLGEEGSVPAYQLTNRIEEGDVAGAVATLHRLLSATTARDPKPMHPLQVIGLLHGRYRKLLRLDDAAIRSLDDAHSALGGKGSTFPTKKALEAERALGTDGLRRAIELLHRADLDLKGASGLPAEAVVEVLVARLAGLSGRSRRGTASRSRRGSR